MVTVLATEIQNSGNLSRFLCSFERENYPVSLV